MPASKEDVKMGAIVTSGIAVVMLGITGAVVMVAHDDSAAAAACVVSVDR